MEYDSDLMGLFSRKTKAVTETEAEAPAYNTDPFSRGNAGLGTATRVRQRTTQLRLMTDEEIRDRSYRAAREQYVAYANRVEDRKALGEYVRYFWGQLMAYAQLFIVCYALYWLYHNQAVVMGWWDSLLQAVRDFAL